MKLKGNYTGKPRVSCALIDAPTNDRIRFIYDGEAYERTIYNRIKWRTNAIVQTVKARFVIVNGEKITLDELENIESETPIYTHKLGINALYDGYRITIEGKTHEFGNAWAAEEFLVQGGRDLDGGMAYKIENQGDATWLVMEF